MNHEIHELSMDELDLVSGGTIVNRIGDAITNAITNAVWGGHRLAPREHRCRRPVVCTEKLNASVLVMKSAQDGA
jgi:hypothetical protein